MEKRKYRNRTCFVSGCTSGYSSNNEKNSTFSPPPDQIESWRNVLHRPNRVLQLEDAVCEKHFLKEDVIRFIMCGSQKVDLRKPKLRKGAVPKIFKQEQQENEEENDCNFDEIKHFLKKPKMEQNLNDDLEDSFIENEKFSDQKLSVEELNSFLLIETTAAAKSETENDIFKEIQEKYLHNCNWGCQYIEREEIIVFSQIEIKEEVPQFNKTILVYKSLLTKAYCGKHLIATKNISCLKEIEDMLNDMSNNKHICLGGPYFNKTYNPETWNSYTAFADHESKRWRHKNCLVILDNNDKSCFNCLKLFLNFSKSLKRSKKRKSLLHHA